MRLHRDYHVNHQTICAETEFLDLEKKMKRKRKRKSFIEQLCEEVGNSDCAVKNIYELVCTLSDQKSRWTSLLQYVEENQHKWNPNRVDTIWTKSKIQILLQSHICLLALDSFPAKLKITDNYGELTYGVRRALEDENAMEIFFPLKLKESKKSEGYDIFDPHVGSLFRGEWVWFGGTCVSSPTNHKYLNMLWKIFNAHVCLLESLNLLPLRPLARLCALYSCQI